MKIRYITYRGITLSMTDWAVRCGMSKQKFAYRLSVEWGMDVMKKRHSFYVWMKRNKQNEDSPVGDLARDMARSSPVKNNIDAWMFRVGGDPYTVQALNEAWSEYRGRERK